MSTISVQPVVTANGEVVLSVTTELCQYLCLFGPDLIMKMQEIGAQGSRVMGLGDLYFDSLSVSSYSYNSLKGLDYTNHLHIYFYNSNGEDPAKFNGKIPSFVDAGLNFDATPITAYVSNKTDVSTITSTKEGIQKERLGVFNLFGTWCGVTAYWPQGYGTGEFDSCCVSLVNLETIRTNTNSNNQGIFAGVCFAVDSANTVPNSTVISYVRNNVTGVTDANTMLLKFAGRAGIWDYNLTTGEITQSSNTYSGYFGIWGHPQFEIDGVLYGLSNLDTASTATGNLGYYIFSYNTTTGESLSYGSYTMTQGTALIKVDSDLYLNTTSKYSDDSTTSTYIPKYYKLDLTTLQPSSTTLTITPMSQASASGWKINSFDDGTYIFHDLYHKTAFAFTDISDIEGSVTEPYFVCGGQPLTFGETTVFMAASYMGLYRDTASAAKNSSYSYSFLANMDYGGCKYMLLDGSIGPLLSYGKLSKTYEKPADADFTSNFYITVTAVNTDNTTTE